MKFFGAIYFAALVFSAHLTRADTVSFYRFESNAGAPASNGQAMTTADDSSGNGLNGTVFGQPTYTSSPFGSVIPATGAINQFAMQCGNGNGVLLNGTVVPILASAFTVEAYFNLSSTNPNTGDVKPIIRVEDPSTGNGVFELCLLNQNGVGGTNDLLLVMSNDTLELNDYDLSANTDYFVAATCIGTTVNLYVDGKLVDSTAIHPQPGFAPFGGSGTNNAAIGNDVSGNLAFKGMIDEVRISNDVLAPSQFLDAFATVPLPPAWLMLCVGFMGVAVSKRWSSNAPQTGDSRGGKQLLGLSA